MKTRLLLVGLLIATMIAPAAGASQRSGGHTLFGDLKIDDSKAPGLKPETFHLVLYNANLQEVGRERVTSGGRYRFLGVGNGEYEIAVQVGNDEIARIHVHIMELQSTDIRKDIELEWRPDRATGSLNKPLTVSADDCSHSSANSERFEKAADLLKVRTTTPRFCCSIKSSARIQRTVGPGLNWVRRSLERATWTRRRRAINRPCRCGVRSARR